MITLDEARRIVAERLGDIRSCEEYANAWVFFSEKGEDADGGCYAPVAVMKEDGTHCSFPAFISRGAGKRIGRIVL